MRINCLLIAIALPLFIASGWEKHRFERPTHPSGVERGQLTGFSGRPFGVHVTRTGDVLVTAQDVDRIVHLDSLGESKAYLGVSHDPGDVIANRAGTIAYVSGFQDGSVAVVDLVADSVVGMIELPTRSAYRLALSPYESRLYVTSTDGRFFVVNTGSRALVSSRMLGGSLQGLALDHAGNNLFASSTTGDIWRVDRLSLQTMTRTHLDCVAQDVAPSNDDRELYVACEKGTVLVLDPRTLETIDEIAVPARAAFGLAVTPDNAQLYVSAPAFGRITIFDRTSRHVAGDVYVKGVPRRIAFTARGDRAYVTNEWNWVNIIN